MNHIVLLFLVSVFSLLNGAKSIPRIHTANNQIIITVDINAGARNAILKYIVVRI